MSVKFETRLFFQREHMLPPSNEGEKRESLVILEKVGMVKGLLKCLGTEEDVTFPSVITITNIDGNNWGQ